VLDLPKMEAEVALPSSSSSSFGEAARLASIKELMSRISEEEAASMNPTLRRSWFTGHFLAPGMEESYRLWQAEMMRPRAKVAFAVGGAMLVGAAALSLQNKHSYKSLMMKAARHDVQSTVLITTFISRVCPFVSAGLMAAPRRIITGQMFQQFVFLSTVIPILVEVLPLIIISSGDAEVLQTLPSPALVGAALVNKSVCITMLTTEDPLQSVRSAYWHALNSDFVLTFAGGFCGLRTIYCFVLGLILTALFHLQLQGLWDFTEMQRGPLWWEDDRWSRIHPSGTVVPLYFRILPFFTMVLVAAIQECAHREQFRYHQLLHLAKNARIEQLHREKDRLIWDSRLKEERERKYGGHSQRSERSERKRVAGVHAPAFHSTVSVAEPAATYAELDLSAVEAHVDLEPDGSWIHADEEGGEGRGGSSSAGSRARATFATTLTTVPPRQPHNSRYFQPSEASSSTSCSELGAILNAASHLRTQPPAPAPAAAPVEGLGRLTCQRVAPSKSTGCSSARSTPSRDMSSSRASSRPLLSRVRDAALWRSLQDLGLMPSSTADQSAPSSG